MSNSLPNLIGERFPVISYVDPATFQKIEELRGDVSRSRFVGKLIQKSIA
jgi:chromosome segregation and condensation protein ScpB